MSEHLSKQFDLDLESVRTHILEMGALVEQQLSRAIEAFGNGNLDLMQQVIIGDQQVNQMEIDIGAECIRIIAKRQPTAGDLRLVVAISRIVTDLERMGDKASKVARMSRKLYESQRMHLPKLAEVRHCGELAVQMLRKALDSLARMDAVAAQSILAEDAVIDEEFNAIMRQVITYMMEDARTISEALDIIWIAKSLERVGDHATNIAESVIYIVSGQDIRHTNGKERT